MKTLCSKSGLLFQCEHFPFYSDTATIAHPCFSIPQKKLLALTPKWAAGELTEVDSYLLFLSLLNSTEQVEFRTHCTYTSDTSSIIYNNMEDLLQLVGAINLITHPTFVLSRIAITKENHTLSNVHYWLENWSQQIDEFKSGYVSTSEQQDLLRRESALERLIKSPYKEVQLASQIANWAELAGNFPHFQISCPFGTMSCAEYWKLIIRKCINSESIFAVPTSDIIELIEHCEENIEHGSIYAHTLMQILRNGKQKQTNFLGLGDWESSFVLLNQEDTVERANLELLVQNAPTEEPRITDYPSKFEWLKAHSKWKLAVAYATGSTDSKGIENEITSL